MPETGILLTLAFDVMLAALAVPFVLGHFWRRASTAAAVTAIVVGSVVRLTFFVLTPTIYGVPNTLLYIDNTLVTEAVDGWSTMLTAALSLLAFAVVALLRRPAAAEPGAVNAEAATWDDRRRVALDHRG